MTTVRELLFGSASGEIEAAEHLAASGAVSSPAVCQAVVSRLSQVLDFEVSDVLLEAFRIQSRLLTAARETHAQPGTVQRVTVKTYELPWEHELELDVTVSGKHLMTITAALRLDLEVTALVAVVQRGLLTDVEGGRYRVSAHLTVQGRDIVSRDRLFELLYELKCGSGIPLISQARAR
ncbi:hypothetical protein Rhe02_63160 [Rhizocola hellebori]|uniref:Uncharacterized protein n=1 Tax=Rhizocola hellebori TaxID=1392758 RepID=A0A8J3QCJ5_9ACTN|nr:hypothetical protein [Rhizocola hellebori]GIH08249.1 hypothetical protein Rhe02_63160 [Rhizocola hellebori]